MSRTTIYTEQNREMVIGHLKRLKIGDGRAWEVEIKKHTKKRSLNQNAYIHKIFDMVAEETGHTAEEIKEFYKGMLLPKVHVSLGMGDAMVNRPTSKLSTKEFADFVDQVIAHATQELGIILPDSSEVQRND